MRHGQHGIDQAAVNGHQVAQVGMGVGQGGGGLSLEFFVNEAQLFQAPGVEGLAITAPFNTFGRSDKKSSSFRT